MKLSRELSEEELKNQMSLISETEEVLKFLEEAARKAIMNESNIQTRSTACNTLFSILDEGEDSVNYILENLDVLFHRYRNRHPNMQDNTLKVYKSRVKSTLEEFQCWQKDPLGWERSYNERAKLQAREKRGKPPSPKIREVRRNGGKDAASGEGYANRGEGRKFSFPIRHDFNLEIALPPDGLSLRELLRLGLFLYPYCRDSDSADAFEAWNPPATSN